MNDQSSQISPGAQPARPAQPLWPLWAGILVALIGWQAILSVRAGWMSPKDPNHVSDFTAFYGAGRLALRGENIYDFRKSGISRRPYLYPPTFAIFPMMLLALLPHNAALVVFTILNYALLIGTFWLMREILWRLRGPPENDEMPDSKWRQWLLHPDTCVLLAFAVCYRYIYSNMHQGNSNMFVAFALALALWLMLKNRAPLIAVSSGVAIALATAIKVTPGLFGLYLLWSWRRWAMVGGAMGLLFFLLVLPAMRFGFSAAIDRLVEYKAHLTSAATGEGGDDDPIGHPGGADQKQLEGGSSVRSVVMRYLTKTKRELISDDKSVTPFAANFADLPEPLARRIAQGVELLILIVTIFLTARRTARTDAAGIALSWGLIAVAMVLVSPLNRPAHLCVLIISSMTAIGLMQQRRITGCARGFCTATLAALALESVVFSAGVIGKYYNGWLRVMGVEFWLLLALFAALCVALWNLKVGQAAKPVQSRIAG